MKNYVKAMLGFGTNLGDKIQNIESALELVSGRFYISAVSAVYSSRSLLEDSQPDYFNIAATVDVDCLPIELLGFLQNIENTMGRQRNVKRYGERVIDIDIIDFGGAVLDSERLKLPHKEMQYRSFVLYPLSDIRPDYTHPISGKTLSEMISALKNNFAILKVADSVRFPLAACNNSCPF